MVKRELLETIDDELLDKLYGFCYARTNDSYEAEDLCSDIIYALIKAADNGRVIENPYPFIWKVARNKYADFSEKRSKHSEMLYEGDPEEVMADIAAAENDNDDEDSDKLNLIYRRIAFLTKAYREVMIAFYLDGLSTADIAKLQNASENTIRQRLFSARQKIKSEVDEMTETYNKPVALDKIDFEIWGTGNPSWGDPRDVCTRMFSNHIVWLCHKKPRTAAEIAEELNVPTVYVEEELEILKNGENGEYGLLRRLDNGKYAINFVLLDKDVFEKATELYTARLPKICDIITDFIETHKKEYLAYPYLNRKVDMNLILWQQIKHLASVYSNSVSKVLEEKHFKGLTKEDRPFSVFGYVDNGKHYGGGCDGISGTNICGYSEVHLENIYITRIRKHFSCGTNISNEPQIQLAIRAIDGLDIDTLTEVEKEHAAKAIESGYLYREGNMLYTGILVSELKSRDLFDISYSLDGSCFEKEAELTAEKLSTLFKKSIPEDLWGEWQYANSLANMPVLDAVVECLIEKGLLTPPENGLGAEGCYMLVDK